MPFGFGTLAGEVSLIGAIDGEGCAAHESTLGLGGLAIWIPFAIYMMVGQFVICEEYFVPTLTMLGDRWNMAEDVQGATLLAVGSSSPELFTAVLGALLLPDENPGPGTNVGSAVFNMCVIIGLSCIFAPRLVKLQVIPFLRDSICYMIGIIELYLFYAVISPGEMEIWESILLVGWWVLYVVIVVRTDLVAVRCCCCIPADERDKTVQEIELDSIESAKQKAKKAGDGDYVALGGGGQEDYDYTTLHRESYNRAKSVVRKDGGGPGQKRGVLYDEKGHPVADYDQNPDNIRIAPGTIADDAVDEELQRLLDELNRKQRQNVNRGWMVVVVPTREANKMKFSSGNDGVERKNDVMGVGGARKKPQSHAYVRRRTLMETLEHERKTDGGKHGVHDDEHDGHGDDHGHGGHGGGILHKILWPWVKLFSWTLPKPEGEFTSKHIYWTNLFIVIWLGILTFFVVDAATKIGSCLHIPADLLGVSLLAVGSSLPDCISSVIVARQMKLDAAVANAFGSNIFDANLAVGFAFVLGSINGAAEGESSNVLLVENEEELETFEPNKDPFVMLIGCAAVYLVLLWIMMWCTIFRLKKWMGWVLLIMYVAFLVVFTILFIRQEDIAEFSEMPTTDPTSSLLPTFDPTMEPTLVS